MGATVEAFVDFGSVADHLAGAMFTDRRVQMNGAFEIIEHVSVSGGDNFECFVVVVAAYFTGDHRRLSVRNPGLATVIEGYSCSAISLSQVFGCAALMSASAEFRSSSMARSPMLTIPTA